MPANKDEIAEAEAENQLPFSVRTSRNFGRREGRVKGLKIEIMERGSIDSSGRRRPFLPENSKKSLAIQSYWP